MLGPQLSLVVFNAVLLTLLICPLVLWRYRRAVLAGMQARTGVGLAPDAPLAPHAPHTVAAAARGGDVAAALDWERRVHRRAIAAVLGVTFVCALPLSALFVLLNDLPHTPLHLSLKAAALAALAVPMAAVLIALPPRRALLRFVVTLLALGAATVVLSVLQRLTQGRAPSADQALNFVLFMQLAGVTLWLPLALLLASGARRVRGVAPIVLAGVLVFALGPLLGMQLTQWLTESRTGARWVLSGPGLDTGFVLLALPMGWLAWWRLKSLARAYEAKRFSDAQLLLRTWWALVVAVEVVELVNAHAQATVLLLLVGVAASALFATLLAVSLRRALALPGRPAPRTLLVLRVFGDSARSEALFDRLVARWRWFGPVTLIAAPDVVARTVDPGDFLRFASGDVSASFVHDAAELQQRLATLDLQPDPDGRFRINEFCCADDTWQATVVQLIERADAVVMDLRGFGAQRQGCAFELAELRARCPAPQVLLLVDGSTDRALLEPLRGSGAARLPLLELRQQRGAAFERACDQAFVRLWQTAA